MDKLTEIKGIINKLKELKISHIDFLKNEIIIDRQKYNLDQQGGFFSESSSDIFSETSNINQNGGNNLYSETSSMKFSFNNNFSDTSIFKQNSDIYSETSELKNSLKGGNTEVDTLQSITELEDSQLDLDIFKKSLNNQNGGFINFNKQKLNELGINSSSTSSVCE